MSSLVFIAGNAKASEEERKRLAESHGVRFFKLQWLDAVVPHSEPTVTGFRTVTVAARVIKGERKVVAKWKVDEAGDPCPDHHLLFHADEFDQGFAYVPDDPDGYNSNKLAAEKLGTMHLWRLPDAAQDAEITQLAEALKSSPEFKGSMEAIERVRVEERVRRENDLKAGDRVEGSDLINENKVLENRIAELEARKRNAELKEKLAKLERADTPAAPAAPTQKQVSSGPEFEAVKAQVWAENAAKIAELKKAHGKDWQKSTGYQEISATITRRVNERTEAYGYAGDSDDDQGGSRS